ncbi:hypothetical protein DBR00_04445 [Pseudomonas sp. HMWF032]|uniref:hypothetical protein n=1 Tax=unclassified Pseudomonas TaxID=196821 RepID=UPI000D367A36|nr:MULTISPECIES: hypothetical protein [unclassified Pseudomonas]PTS85052.1 hypothetical protein DBR00_04445 [Pseudomonas sp. HMWF032]PTT83445.1 hypothetical protein DBR41_10715 [Pseudomonas sp. HMWF010]WAC46516.1 hypothetical protein OU997_10275 [Pseudomonas sp. SL4(2022)]
MSKRWITAAVATAIVGGVLGVVLSADLEQPKPTQAASNNNQNGKSPTPNASLAAQAPGPAARQHTSGASTLQAKPPVATSRAAQATLWDANSLQETESNGITQHLTQVDPEQLNNLAVGQVVALALPGRSSPTRASLGETRNTAGSAVWQGSLIDGDEVESMTLIKGALETHITVATLDGSLSIIIDNATGKTVITDENQLVLRADPNDHLHYDHKELAPLPPPAQG